MSALVERLRHRRHRRRHPERHRLLAGLLPIESASPAAVRAHQAQAFDDIVRYAARSTAFYRNRFAAPLAAGESPFHNPVDRPVDGLIDPATLPVLTKADLVAQRDRLLVGAMASGARLGHTGGSTGQPVSFYYDDAKLELMRAAMMRGFMMSGWRPGQRVLYLWGAARDARRRGVFGERAQGPLAMEKTIAADSVDEARLAAWCDMLQRWRPAVVYGYASMLAELAAFLVGSGRPPPPSLVAVYSTAEVLDPSQRELMEGAFGCKVYNQYGCREVPNIAWECRHGQMHIFPDMVHLESVETAGEARLLVTSLTNRLFPFIRYELGDHGRLLDGDCDCGLPFPLMEMQVCRRNDLVRIGDGRRLHPSYFNRLLTGVNGVRQYQWVQRGPDSMALDLVARRQLAPEQVAGIERHLRRELDPRFRLEIRYRDAIPRNRAGKHRYVIGLDRPPEVV